MANCSLSSNLVNCIRVLADNTICFGTNAGLSCLKDTSWTNHSLIAPGVVLEPVNDIIQDVQGRLYVATNNGLAVHNTGIWSIFRSTNSPLPANHCKSLSFDANENLWVGTINGLAVYNENGVNLSVSKPTAEDVEFEIFPNPSKSDVWVISRKYFPRMTLRIYNAGGQLIRNETYHPFENESVRLNISDLQKGVYFMEMRTEEGVQTRKFIHI
jgi:ligand-binding sensor domain-containing protein